MLRIPKDEPLLYYSLNRDIANKFININVNLETSNVDGMRPARLHTWQENLEILSILS